MQLSFVEVTLGATALSSALAADASIGAPEQPE
jgi:hypothetical protein